MGSNKFISIIIPVYNGETYLVECVDSVLSQNYDNFEIIIVDDGSTDSTAAICDNYADKHELIRVLHQQNGGVTKARRNGAIAAKGEWIMFVDADDYFSDNNYLSKFINAPYNGIIIGGNQDRVITSDEFIDGLLNNSISWRVVNKLYPKQYIIEALSIDRYFNIGEDFLCNILLAKSIDQVKQINVAGYILRENEISVTHTRKWSYEYETNFINKAQSILESKFNGGISLLMINAWKNLLINGVNVPVNNSWRRFIIDNQHSGRKSVSEIILLYMPFVPLQKFLLKFLNRLH